MKKSLYTILAAGIILFSIQCSDEPIKSGKRFEADIKTTPAASGYICANIPTELNISLLADNGETDNYRFSFVSHEGEGKLFIDNTRIPENDTVTLKNSRFKAYYIPESLGEHRLKLIFSNKDYRTETVYSISVDKYSMDITEATAEDIYLDREMDLRFHFSAENDTSNYFKTNISITKGEGKLSQTGSGITSETPDSSFLSARNKHTHIIKKGMNHIQYTPFNAGEHNLLLSVTNTYGYTQDFEFSFNADYPEYTLNASVADSSISIYSQARFSLHISGDEEYYPASFRFLKNNGHVTINGYTPGTNREFNLPSGKSGGHITADSTGESIVEFSVRDRYDRILKDTVHFSVIPAHTDIIVREFDTMPVTGKEYPFQIDVINEDGYTGKYSMTIKGNGAKIKVKDKITGEDEEIIFSQTTSASYIPESAGKNTLTIQVTDDKKQMTLRELSYTAIQTYREISVREYNPLVKYGEKRRVYFDILSNTEETYTCKLHIPEGAGKTTLNGQECPETCSAGKSNYFDFIPSLPRKAAVTIEITSNTGHVVTKDVTFSVSSTEISISATGFQNGNPNIKTSVPIYASFNVSKPESTGSFKCRFSGTPAGNTLYKINGEDYTEGEELNIPFNRNIPATLSFLRSGKQEISLHIQDDEGNNEEIKFEYTVTESPLILNIREFSSVSLPGVENTVYFSIEKKDYNGNFQCLIETTGDPAGTFKINGEEYQPGNKTGIPDKENTKLSFIPKKPGETNISITISDDNGSQITENLSYDIRNPELEVTVIPPGKIITGQEANIRFSVTKAHYSGRFLAEFTGTDFPMQLNGQEYSGGKTEVLSGNNDLKITASRTGNICLKIYDEWGSKVEKNIEIQPVEPAMELNVHTSSRDIHESTNFIVTASHESGNDMTLSLKTFPSGAGKFYIDTEECTSKDIRPGKAINVVFKPSTTGEITVTVGLNDKTTGIHKEKQIVFNSLSTIKYPIVLTPTNNENSVLVYHPIQSKLQIQEENYSDRDYFKYEITKVSGNFNLTNNQEIPYTFEKKYEVPAESSSLFFTIHPTGTEDIIFDVTITDKHGQSATQRFHYAVINKDTKIDFRHCNESTFIGKEETFYIHINKTFFSTDFSMNIHVQGNISDFRIYENKVALPAKLTCRTGELIPISYISENEGELKFIISVTDEFGLTNVENFTVNVFRPDEIEILTIPVEYVLTKAPSLINDSSYFETYVRNLHFLGHDGEGRINDYETTFSNTEHLTVFPHNDSQKQSLGEISFPVYTYDKGYPVDNEQRKHISLEIDYKSCIYLKYSKAGDIKINWGCTFVNSTSNTPVLNIPHYTECHAGGADKTAFEEFFPFTLTSHQPFFDDIKDCKLIVYCDIEPSPYKINIAAKEFTVQENKPAAFKFSYSSHGGDMKHAKVSINKIMTSKGDISDIKINGIPLREGVYLAPEEEATVTFIPQGRFQLYITLSEGKNSIISDNILFISQ